MQNNLKNQKNIIQREFAIPKVIYREVERVIKQFGVHKAFNEKVMLLQDKECFDYFLKASRKKINELQVSAMLDCMRRTTRTQLIIFSALNAPEGVKIKAMTPKIQGDKIFITYETKK